MAQSGLESPKSPSPFAPSPDSPRIHQRQFLAARHGENAAPQGRDDNREKKLSFYVK